jgi:hypothetical protein
MYQHAVLVIEGTYAAQLEVADFALWIQTAADKGAHAVPLGIHLSSRTGRSDVEEAFPTLHAQV